MDLLVLQRLLVYAFPILFLCSLVWFIHTDKDNESKALFSSIIFLGFSIILILANFTSVFKGKVPPLRSYFADTNYPNDVELISGGGQIKDIVYVHYTGDKCIANIIGNKIFIKIDSGKYELEKTLKVKNYFLRYAELDLKNTEVYCTKEYK